MNERKVLTLRQGGYSENEVLFIFTLDGLNVSVENPWAGDSETGFGRTCYADLSREDARRLLEFLREHVGGEK